MKGLHLSAFLYQVNETLSILQVMTNLHKKRKRKLYKLINKTIEANCESIAEIEKLIRSGIENF